MRNTVKSTAPSGLRAWWGVLNEELDMFGQAEAGFKEARELYTAEKTPAIAAQIIAAERVERARLAREAMIPRLPNGRVDLDAAARGRDAAMARVEAACELLIETMERCAAEALR